VSVDTLAFVGGDRQIWTMSATVGGHKQMTFGEGPGARSPWGVLESRDHSSWPCWSPDGRWLSCFQTRVGPSGDGQVWLSVLETEGVEEQRLSTLEAGIPIYSQWSPDSRQVAVVSQEETHLSLGVCTLGVLGEYRLIEEGVPLFFSWTADAERLLIHSGSGGDTRLVLRDVAGDAPDTMFKKMPGNFCTPLIVGSQAIFIGRDEAQGVLCVSDWHGARVEGITVVEGLVGIVASPDGRYLAFSGAPPGNRQPYQGLWVADLEAGKVRRLSKEGLIAFFWAPDSSAVVVVTRGRGPAEMMWSILHIDGGEIRPLATFYPSLDQKFFLHFFEQFAVSHSPISADGRHLVFSSHPSPKGQGSDTTAHICAVDLSEDTPHTQVLVPGDFAVFSPGDFPVL
jgi:hypothetical protein